MPANSGDSGTQVCKQHREDGEGGPAQPEALPDQPAEALAGGQPETRANLLGDRQRQHARQQGPHQAVAELRTGQRVGRDPARVVVRKAADQPWSEHGEEGQPGAQRR